MKKSAVAGVASPVEEAEAKLCECGCGQAVNPKREFRAGHDMKLRSALLGLWDDGQGAMAEELVTRGWYTWEQLEQRQADRAEKAAKKAIKKSETKAAVSSGSVRSDVVSSTAKEGAL